MTVFSILRSFAATQLLLNGIASAAQQNKTIQQTKQADTIMQQQVHDALLNILI